MNEITTDEVQRVVRDRKLKRMEMGKCSMCGYPLAFVFQADAVGFDPGCWCVRQQPGIEPRRWDSVASHFNIQNPDVRDRMWAEFSGQSALGQSTAEKS